MQATHDPAWLGHFERLLQGLREAGLLEWRCSATANAVTLAAIRRRAGVRTRTSGNRRLLCSGCGRSRFVGMVTRFRFV